MEAVETSSSTQVQGKPGLCEICLNIDFSPRKKEPSIFLTFQWDSRKSMMLALYNVREEVGKPTKVLFVSLWRQGFAVIQADIELTT